MPRLCVYCGSHSGASAAFTAAARSLGAALASDGVGLVYGGGSVGLMGEVADAALEGGGEVVGVITEQLVDAEVALHRVTRLEVVATMHERKARMEQLADGFVVLPGGFGTVDEFAEMLTWNQLGIVAKPVVLLDVDGYWQHLVAWVDHATSTGFVRDVHRQLLQVASTPADAVRLALRPAPTMPAKWDRSPPRP